MANLILLQDDANRKLDTLVDISGAKGYKRGVAGKAVAGLTDEALSAGVATHADSDDFNAADGVVVAAGVLPGSPDTVVRFLVDALGRLLVAAGPSSGEITDRSGTITAGGTAQTLAAINADRRYLFILNDADETEDLWIDFTTTADVQSPSIRIPPGASFTFEAGFVSTELISVIAATTGHVFTAKEG